MYSAVSGLSAHQTKMDVIGNNIANVNTVGFKSGRVTFQEVFSQTIRGASAPQDDRGGSNPQQIGLGANVASIDTIFTRGAAEATGVAADLMINGDNGFFIVSNDSNFANRSYTRAGNFKIDAAGNLVTTEGYRVLGYPVEESSYGGKPVYKTSLEGLKINQAATVPAQITTKATASGNLDSETKLLDPAPANLISEDPTDRDAVYIKTADGKYETNPDYADCIAREYTFEVNDKLGGTHTIRQAFIKTNENEFTVVSFYEGKDGTMTSFKDGATTNPATEVISFEDGIWESGGPLELTIDGAVTNGAGAVIFNVNYNDLTSYASDSNASAEKDDGYKAGTLDGYTIGADGTISGIFSNGVKTPLGRIAIANFKNPAGLQKTDSNMFINTANSGDPIIGKPGEAGFASLNPGTLEMSNVDLSREFTYMITTQRGFQANSRVITTTDQMLEELVNLKR